MGRRRTASSREGLTHRGEFLFCFVLVLVRSCVAGFGRFFVFRPRVYFVCVSPRLCLFFVCCLFLSSNPSPGKQINSFDAVIHTQESTHQVPKSASQAVLTKTQLALYASRRTTSRRFALGVSNVCLIGENPTCSVPTLWVC